MEDISAQDIGSLSKKFINKSFQLCPKITNTEPELIWQLK
jgi:hypothetical protein